jgi:tetratricopeptide (TPR) repeat protein
MLALSDSPGRTRLKKEATSHFRSCGWQVTDFGGDFKMDFSAQKDGTRFFVGCLDESILRYRDGPSIVSQLRDDARHFRVRVGVTFLAITNFRFPGASTDALAQSGLALLTGNELGIASGLDRLQVEMPGDLNVTELLILEGCMKLCIAVADRFRAQGDLDKAIEWAERALRGSSGVTVAHRRLAGWYHQKHDTEAVERIVSSALRINPKNVEHLKWMQRLSSEKGDKDAEAHWATQIEAASEIAPNFENIVKKHGGAISVTLKNQATNERQSFIKRFFLPRS